MIPTIARLIAGASLGHPWQRPIWAAAVVYDFAAVFFTANAPGRQRARLGRDIFT